MTLLEPEKWVDKYADYLYNYAIVRVNDHIVAQEIVSETFLSGLKGQNRFKGKSSERTWLISILKRKIIDYYRKINTIKRRSEISIDYKDLDIESDWLEENVPDLETLGADEVIMNEELGLAILDCMDQLEKNQAEVFRMKSIEELDTKTICKEMNITPSNLWVILHRARKKMMECLEENWFK